MNLKEVKNTGSFIIGNFNDYANFYSYMSMNYSMPDYKIDSIIQTLEQQFNEGTKIYFKIGSIQDSSAIKSIRIKEQVYINFIN